MDKPTTNAAKTVTITDNVDRQDRSNCRCCRGTVGPEVIDIRKLYADTRTFHLRSRLHLDRQLRIQDHLYRRRQGRAALSRLSDRGAGRATATSWRSATCCSTANCRTPTQKDEVRARHHLPHHGARAAARLLPRLPPRRASDGGDVRRGRRAVGLLSRLAPTSPIRASARSPRYRLIAKMPTIAAMAYKYSIGQPFIYPQQRARLRRELPAHDVRRAVRGLQGQPGARARRWTASSSCTPTTSRTPRPRPCASPARRAPIPSPASPPASPRCGARPMAAPTRPC